MAHFLVALLDSTGLLAHRKGRKSVYSAGLVSNTFSTDAYLSDLGHDKLRKLIVITFSSFDI